MKRLVVWLVITLLLATTPTLFIAMVAATKDADARLVVGFMMSVLAIALPLFVCGVSSLLEKDEMKMLFSWSLARYIVAVSSVQGLLFVFLVVHS